MLDEIVLKSFTELFSTAQSLGHSVARERGLFDEFDLVNPHMREILCSEEGSTTRDDRGISMNSPDYITNLIVWDSFF